MKTVVHSNGKKILITIGLIVCYFMTLASILMYKALDRADGSRGIVMGLLLFNLIQCGFLSKDDKKFVLINRIAIAITMISIWIWT